MDGKETKGGLATKEGRKMGENIRTQELFRGTNGAITKNGNVLSDVIDLTGLRLEASFALHTIHVGGDITVTVRVCSTKTGTFMEVTTPVQIVADFAAGSGYWAFTPPVAPYMKLRFAENNTAAVTSMDAWLNYQ
jgi:hypothetical protein